MKILRFSTLFLFIIPGSTFFSQGVQPELTQLFSGIANCDLFITRDGSRTSDPSFQLLLPTTLYTFWARGSYGLFFDITQLRVPPCRIIYALDDLVGLFYDFPLQPYRYRTKQGWQNIASKENIFPLAFLNASNVDWDYNSLKWRIETSGLESLGVIKISKNTLLEICWIIAVFKFRGQTETSVCSTVTEENNVLEIFQRSRQPPREWFTEGEHLGLSLAYLDYDLTTLKQTLNPMNRLERILSVHVHHIQAVFF